MLNLHRCPGGDKSPDKARHYLVKLSPYTRVLPHDLLCVPQPFMNARHSPPPRLHLAYILNVYGYFLNGPALHTVFFHTLLCNTSFLIFHNVSFYLFTSGLIYLYPKNPHKFVAPDSPTVTYKYKLSASAGYNAVTTELKCT